MPQKTIVWKLGPVKATVDAVVRLAPIDQSRLRHRPADRPIVAHLAGFTIEELGRIGCNFDARYPGLYRCMPYLTSSGVAGTHGAAIFPASYGYDRARAIMADVLV
jgi:hypothetical protein